MLCAAKVLSRPCLSWVKLCRLEICGTAALPLKPDIGWRGWHVRKVPTTVIGAGWLDHPRRLG